MGETGNGVVVAGDFCARDADVPGIKFADLLLSTYRKDGKQPNTMYVDGIIEAMTQVYALNLAAAAVGDPTKLTTQDVLEKGFYQIKDMDTGGIYVSKFTYGKDKVQGVDQIRIQQVQGGKIVDVGSTPLFNIVAAKK